jgi:hypothetical protein
VAARVILVEMAPLAGIVGAVSLALVRFYGGDDIADVQEPSVVGPSLEVLSWFRQDLTRSSEE